MSNDGAKKGILLGAILLRPAHDSLIPASPLFPRSLLQPPTNKPRDFINACVLEDRAGATLPVTHRPAPSYREKRHLPPSECHLLQIARGAPYPELVPNLNTLTAAPGRFWPSYFSSKHETNLFPSKACDHRP